MGEHSGKRITPTGREAPVCIVRFRCPKCFREAAKDAYRGPVSCSIPGPTKEGGHALVFMEPVSVMRDTPAPEPHTRPPTTHRVPG